MPRRVFVNQMLSGVQQRNLERAWGRPVVDRMGLIIDIFAQRARTKEARLQVGLHACLHARSPGHCNSRSSSPVLKVSSYADSLNAPAPTDCGGHAGAAHAMLKGSC